MIHKLYCTNPDCAKLYRDENGICSRAGGCKNTFAFTGTHEEYIEFRRANTPPPPPVIQLPVERLIPDPPKKPSGRKRAKRALISTDEDGTETRYESVVEALTLGGIGTGYLYHALKSGLPYKGNTWRYAE